ncbi:hypothetical protein AB0M29_32995 [Streptomyces sp. NPDC051976]|uniref:hypothetical protein n=1 Tax=Streptomyces sp. NPDC051976 TaxID=3154947 RepID=UPI00342873C4
MAAVLPRRSRAAVRAWAAALVVLAGALTAGCGGGGGAAAPTATPDRNAAARALLDQRAAAVLHHDSAAFLAGVDPRNTRFVAAQRRMFTDLTDVPLSAWSYRLVRTGAFPLPATADGTARTAAEVELRYRIGGYDTEPIVSTSYLTLSQRDGHWYVAGDGDGAASGHRGTVQLWDQGRVRVVRGAHSLVLGLGDPAVLRGYATDADRAVPQVTHAWGAGWPGKVVIEAPRTLDQMAALLNATPATYKGIAAVTTGEAGGTTQAPADRVILNPAAFGELSAFGRQVVLTHETTHVATRTLTTTGTPLWLSEGAADWTAYRDSGRSARQIAPELAADVDAGKVPAALPTDADFRTTATRLPQAYEGAWLACRMIADDWSPAKLTALYGAIAHGASPDAAMRATLGVGLPEFTTRWRAYVRQELA